LRRRALWNEFHNLGANLFDRHIHQRRRDIDLILKIVRKALRGDQGFL
jgi:hypothetical protein